VAASASPPLPIRHRHSVVAPAPPPFLHVRGLGASWSELVVIRHELSRSGSHQSTLQAAADGSRRPHFSAPAGAMSASTSPALRAIHQLRLPRRPTCPSLRSSNRRVRAIQSPLDSVRWSARTVTPSEEAGSDPQAAGPPDRPTRAPGPRHRARNPRPGTRGQEPAGSWPPAGQRQPTAPAAPLQQRQRRFACRLSSRNVSGPIP
jgi:hypothetical protein